MYSPLKLKKTRKKRVDYEGPEQEVIFNWLYYQHREIWEMAYHPANGGKRNVSEAARLKRQGVKAGVSDINIDIPKNGYHGLRIELKATPPNDCPVTDSQQKCIDNYNKYGYRAVVCKGVNAAKAEIKNYFDL